jgi:hypothetical protein
LRNRFELASVGGSRLAEARISVWRDEVDSMANRIDDGWIQMR